MNLPSPPRISRRAFIFCALSLLLPVTGCHRPPLLTGDGGPTPDGRPVGGGITPLALLVRQNSDRSLAALLVYDRAGNRVRDLMQA